MIIELFYPPHESRSFPALPAMFGFVRLRILAAALVLAAGLLAAMPAGAAEPARAARIEAWIDDLNSDLYVVRERATERLEAAGPAAADALARAADGNRLETAARAVRLLRQLSESDDLQIATAALERLAGLKNRPTERRAAEAILQGMRSRAALAAIKRLGGVEKESYALRGETVTGVIGQLVLGEDWKGGDEGLKHIRALERVQRLSIHGAPITDKGLVHLRGLTNLARLELYGTEATPAGVEALAKTMPGVEIDFRRGALLGVAGGAHPKGALVSFVAPDSAAWRAGIQPGDVITKMNGQTFDGFKGLTALIAKCKPGDKAALELLRDGQPLSKEVVFGAWK